MVEHGVVKHMLPLLLSSIKFKEKIYLPRIFIEINLKYIQENY